MTKCSRWTFYWSHEVPWTYPELYKVNAELFVQQLQGTVEWNPGDRILNIGCGPAYLERLLAPKINQIAGMDISSRMIEAAQSNCAHLPNTRFFQLQSSRDLQTAHNNKYTKILMISVAQYFDSMEIFTDYLQQAMELLETGGVFVLADLPQTRTAYQTLMDFSCAIKRSLKFGYFFILLKKMTLGIPKILRYRIASQHNHHLVFNKKKLENLFRSLGLSYQFLNFDLSICPNRFNFIITK